ncbi:nucleoside 2-deoxyribosyltransferase [Desulfobacula sp.]|uniref:nucleoside 2-deoxyribosyltransferase n=1 Tax=Desulfobacula sp. TaxID=2593537 RepID=UPI00261E1939|nr:nucleoside 2-deoxyribosyltransferase [Desulfobacula sp.]
MSLHEGKPIMFLGGPITHLAKKGSPNNQYKNIFFEVFSELSKHAHVKSAHIEEDFGNIIYTPTEIAQRDLNWIDKAHILLFIFPMCFETGMPLRTDGTFIELGYAATKLKPTAVFMADTHNHSLLTQGLLQQKPWIHSKQITLEAILETAYKMLDELSWRN